MGPGALVGLAVAAAALSVFLGRRAMLSAQA
jgi:hypothetical protein